MTKTKTGIWETLAKATHSSTLAWKILWMEEPGGLQSMGSLRVSHDWVTSLSLFTSCIREGNGNPLQCSCLENPRDRGAWWAAIYGVAQSQTQLKRLSSSSSSTKLYLCGTDRSQGAWFLQLCSSFSRLFWLFRVFHGSTQVLELFFLVLWKMPLVFW